MASAQIGDTVTAHRQADERFVINRFGIGEFTLNWKFYYPRMEAILRDQLYYGAPHPDFPQLLLEDREGGRENGNIGVITTVYRGATFNPSDPLPAPEYNTDISLSSEPLPTNSRYKTLTSTELRQVQKWFDSIGEENQGDAIPSGWRDLMQEYAGKLLKGQTSYLRPGTIHTINYISNSRPGQKLKYMGKVIGSPKGAPSLPDGQEWLMVGLGWQTKGSYFSCLEKYQASGDGGWDKDFYGNNGAVFVKTI